MNDYHSSDAVTEIVTGALYRSNYVHL